MGPAQKKPIRIRWYYGLLFVLPFAAIMDRFPSVMDPPLFDTAVAGVFLLILVLLKRTGDSSQRP